MISHARIRFSILMILLISFLVSGSANADIKKLISEATSSFKDISLTCKVERANIDELKKIGKDFSKSYEFKRSAIRYKSPEKMRIDGRLGMINISLIINGNTKEMSVPGLHISKRENLDKDPHKRQSDLDIGIVTGTIWDNYTVKNVVEEKTPDGPVYRITYAFDNSTNMNHVCWVDAKTLKLLKVETYKSDGSLRARFIYSKHTYVQGVIWVPGRIEVYNGDGKLAGVTCYEDIKVNTGILDSVFKL